MPAKNVEQLKQKTARLKKKLAEKATSMEAVAVRKAKKTIRRTQRHSLSRMSSFPPAFTPKPKCSSAR